MKNTRKFTTDNRNADFGDDLFELQELLKLFTKLSSSSTIVENDVYPAYWMKGQVVMAGLGQTLKKADSFKKCVRPICQKVGSRQMKAFSLNGGNYDNPGNRNDAWLVGKVVILQF